jgi:hypothetical protein
VGASNRHRRKPAEAPPAARPVALHTAAPVRPWHSLALFLILLASSLALWRLVLLQPLEALSRGAIQGVFSLLSFPASGSSELITVDPGNGDWVVHASLLLLPEREITRQIAGAEEAGVRVQPVMLQCFSLCLPLFWALALAVWPGKQLWRILGIGTPLLAIISEASLVVFLAYWSDRYFVVASSTWSEFCLQLAGYLTLNVVPYATPLVVVIALHRRLRSLVFGGYLARIQPSPAP